MELFEALIVTYLPLSHLVCVQVLVLPLHDVRGGHSLLLALALLALPAVTRHQIFIVTVRTTRVSQYHILHVPFLQQHCCGTFNAELHGNFLVELCGHSASARCVHCPDHRDCSRLARVAQATTTTGSDLTLLKKDTY